MTQPGTTTRKAKLLSINEALLVGSFGNICVVIWRSPPTIAAVERVSLEYSRMKSQFPSGFAPVIIVEDGVGLPDEAARKGLADLMDMYGRSMFCMAGVQEATGFRGAAIRSVLTAIDMLSQAPYPRRLFATVEQAAPWLTQHCMAQPNSAPITAGSLIAAVTELRRAPSLTAPSPSIDATSL